MPCLLIGLTFCDRPVQPEWAVSLVHLTSSMPINTTFGMATTKGAPIAESRNAIAKHALESGSKYLLFLDDDTAPPNFTISRLMSILDTQPDVGCAGGIYSTKTVPSHPVVGRKEKEGPSWNWKVGDVFDCEVLGTGCLMIRVDVFKSLEQPWFAEESIVNPDGPGEETMLIKTTDDIFFLRKVKAAGYRIVADGGVLPIHWDVATGTPYMLEPNSFPFRNESIEKAQRISGWMSAAELDWLGKQASKYSNIVELGSYMGRSTRVLGDNTKGKVLAIDTFNGPVEAPHPLDPETIYQCFVENLKDLIISGKVIPWKQDHATVVIEPLTYDMIFIDGSHDYESVIRDITKGLDALKHGGLLCGHDANWPGVNQATQELLPGVQVAPQTNIWYYEKKTQCPS